MCSFVRHSTPTDALRIIYNIKPLHLHIKEVAMNTFFRCRFSATLIEASAAQTYLVQYAITSIYKFCAR